MNDTIRRAGPDDAQTLSRLAAETFCASFGDLYWPADLEAFIAEAYDVARIRGELADPAVAVWLAERGGAAVGYAVAGPCDLPHPEVTADCGELKRVYLLPSAQGGGLGSRLIEAAFAWLLRAGPRSLWIGAWSGNRGARKLYERLGFQKVGEYYYSVGGALDREFILRRD